MEINPILDKSFSFAIAVIAYCEILEQDRKYVIAKQLIRSGTSIGANVREVQHPHSRADFISKMVIAAKEANETEYWLLLCKLSKNYPDPNQLLPDIKEILKILSSIISKAKRSE